LSIWLNNLPAGHETFVRIVSPVNALSAGVPAPVLPALSAVERSEVEGIRTKNPSACRGEAEGEDGPSSRLRGSIFFSREEALKWLKKIAKRSMPKMKRGMWENALITNQDLTPYPLFDHIYSLFKM
jgi:hypothetical protein